MSNEGNDLPSASLEYDSSPLEVMLIELHEVHEGLVSVGFDPEDASRIIAYMLGDALSSRGAVFEDEEDEDDDEVDFS